MAIQQNRIFKAIRERKHAEPCQRREQKSFITELEARGAAVANHDEIVDRVDKFPDEYDMAFYLDSIGGE